MAIFENLHVIELASVLAGPSVGQFFAELGAQVVKVENPVSRGDVTRTWKLARESKEDTRSAYFYAANWGKKSVSIDLTTSHGRDELYRMAATADIIICSYKKGDAEKLRVDYATLSAINPRLIYANITGYTTADLPGYDAVIQAESGFMYMNGTPEGGPVKMPVALVDVLAAHQLKEGVLVALLQRAAQGKGALVEVSLFDAAVSSLANQATNYLCAGHDPERIGSEHPNIVPYGTIFKTKDRKMILLAVGTDKQFRQLTTVLNMPSVCEDERFQTNAARVRYRAPLITMLKRAIGGWESGALLKELHAHQVPAGAVNRVSEALNSPEAAPLILKGKGIRNAVFRINGADYNHDISEPPEYINA